MSLLGIDIGTTGCKAAAFSEGGQILSSSYQEYQIQRPNQGWAELDSSEVWEKIKFVIKVVASDTLHDPITSLAVSSLGESLVPISHQGDILGLSMLNFDMRGEEFLDQIRDSFTDEHIYNITGNIFGSQYSLPKLMWLKKYQSDLYRRAFKFLLWGSFVQYKLGAEPVVDYSLANRTLLFDIKQKNWSQELSLLIEIDIDKLPKTVPSGIEIGKVSSKMAAELGLPKNVIIVSGAHDQCSCAVGCGVTEPEKAVFSMGTYLSITPVFNKLRSAGLMMVRGLNSEHHAVPGKYVCFIYNQAGSIVKWYRDTFASSESQSTEIYPRLFSELPDELSSVIVLPHFAITGPPSGAIRPGMAWVTSLYSVGFISGKVTSNKNLSSPSLLDLKIM